MLQTIIIYICGSIAIRWLYFENYALLSIGMALFLFYLISEYFEDIYNLFKHLDFSSKHLLSVLSILFLLFMSLNGYFKSAIEATYICSLTFIMFCVFSLYPRHNYKELLYYPFTRLLFWLSIIWFIRTSASSLFNRYEITSIETARIREALQSTANDWHPPLLWPRIVSDPELTP